MNWHCCVIYGERPKPFYYVAEQSDVTELETFRFKERLLFNPNDNEALRFFYFLGGWKASQGKSQ